METLSLIVIAAGIAFAVFSLSLQRDGQWFGAEAAKVFEGMNYGRENCINFVVHFSAQPLPYNETLFI